MLNSDEKRKLQQLITSKENKLSADRAIILINRLAMYGLLRVGANIKVIIKSCVAMADIDHVALA